MDVPKIIDNLVNETMSKMPLDDLNSLWSQLHPEQKDNKSCKPCQGKQPEHQAIKPQNYQHHHVKRCKPKKKPCHKKCKKPCEKPCPMPCPPMPNCVIPICPLPVYEHQYSLRDPHYITEYEHPIQQSLFMPWHLMVPSDEVIIFRTNPRLPGTKNGLSQVLVQLPDKPRFGKPYKIGILHSDSEHKSCGQLHITRGDAAVFPVWKTIKSTDDGSFPDFQFVTLLAYPTEQGLVSWATCDLAS
jgi:hypothetical protein